MNEQIIVVLVCLSVVGLVGYFLYSRISDQQTTIEMLMRRNQMIEAYLSRPSVRDELNKIPASEQQCETCDVAPIDDVTDVDIDKLVDEEVASTVSAK